MGAEPLVCLPVHCRHAGRGLPGAGQCRAGGDRRRSPLCRHGPFRPQPHSPCLVRPRAAGADDQLSRPGCLAHRPSGGRLQSLLPDGAGMGAAAAGGAGNSGHHHRIAGCHFGRFLGDAASHPARLSAAHEDRPHLSLSIWSDLHSGGELDAVGAGDVPGAGLPVLLQPCCRLWHCRHRHDADRYAVGGRAGADHLALAGVVGGTAAGDLPHCRFRLFRVQPDEGA